MNGGRDRLSQRELEYVGFGDFRRDTSGGWHQPDTIPDHLPPNSALLFALMDIDRDRLEFLG